MDGDSVSQIVGGSGPGREIVRAIQVEDLEKRQELQRKLRAVENQIETLESGKCKKIGLEGDIHSCFTDQVLHGLFAFKQIELDESLLDYLARGLEKRRDAILAELGSLEFDATKID